MYITVTKYHSNLIPGSFCLTIFIRCHSLSFISFISATPHCTLSLFYFYFFFTFITLTCCTLFLAQCYKSLSPSSWSTPSLTYIKPFLLSLPLLSLPLHSLSLLGYPTFSLLTPSYRSSPVLPLENVFPN